jgi:uncharacterized membrane protein YkvA (DUF1232 family)
MVLESGLVTRDDLDQAPVGWWRGNGLARMLIALVALITRELKIYMLVTKDDRTPRRSKILLWTAVVYALSPIGLVPDFIPIVGYVDDAIIVPILVFIAVRRVPGEVLAECRSRVMSLGAESS